MYSLLMIRLIYLLFVVSQVSSSGTFKLELLQFNNDNGLLADETCCSGQLLDGTCTEQCNTHFRICFKHFERDISPHGECTFGEFTTEVLGNNSFMFPRSKGPFTNPLEFDFTFAWRGDFNLIIEAYHEVTLSSSEDHHRQQLIAQFLHSGSAAPGAAPHSMQLEGNSKTLNLTYNVECALEYYGPGCQKLCIPRNDMLGHYTCGSNGERVCRQGWRGEYCTEAICLEGCSSEHGHCTTPNECSCEGGWTGRFCTECELYPGCDHGTCNDAFTCVCNEGWGGIYCNQDLNYCTNHRPCKNGGTCANAKVGSYTCTCPIGFAGTDCEHEVDNCQIQPCVNGGECRDVGNDFICRCPIGFAGNRCEISASRCEENPCDNGGQCQQIGSGYRCECADGWTGVNCQTQIDDCQSAPCLNGGQCVDEQNGFHCNCPAGKSGTTCEIDKNECAGENPCANGGECFNGDNEFECRCRPGYVGTLCEINVDDCNMQPCANGGTCIDGVNTFNCQCAPGFTGDMCNDEINECASHPCQHGGTCYDLTADFHCICTSEYEGNKCQYKLGSYPYDTTRLIPSAAFTTTESAVTIQPEAVVGNGPENGDKNGIALTTSQLILVVCLGCGIPLLLLLVLVSILLHRRCKKNNDLESSRQNQVNMMNNKLENDLGNKMVETKKGQDYPTAGELSKDRMEISMNSMTPDLINDTAAATAASAKIVHKDMIKDINTVRDRQRHRPAVTESSAGHKSAELYIHYYQNQRNSFAQQKAPESSDFQSCDEEVEATGEHVSEPSNIAKSLAVADTDIHPSQTLVGHSMATPESSIDLLYLQNSHRNNATDV